MNASERATLKDLIDRAVRSSVKLPRRQSQFEPSPEPLVFASTRVLNHRRNRHVSY